MLIPASSMLATFGAHVTLVNQIAQGTQLWIRSQDHTATVAAVATIWSSARPIFLAQKADTAATTVAGLRMDSDFVNEMHIRKKPLAGLFVKQGLS
jgi:hypothetical protein